MARKLSKQDVEQMQSIVERMSDPRLRYFFLMLGSAIADLIAAEKPRASPLRSRDQGWIARIEQ